jgi:hypothetical protein
MLDPISVLFGFAVGVFCMFVGLVTSHDPESESE